MKLERLLAIIILLLNQKKMTSKALADYFEVSERTIYRDIDSINKAGIPIVSYQGRDGGLGIMDTYKMDRNVLTKDELGMIIMALTGMKATLDDRRFDYLLEKVKNLIPEKELRELRKEQEYIVIDFQTWKTGKAIKERFELIRRAIEDSKIISFSYTNAKGEFTERHVEPMVIMAKGFTWYLYAYCLMRKDFRVFRLSRLKDVKILDEIFTRREAPSSYSWQDLWYSKVPLVDVVMRFTPEIRVKVEDYFSSEQIEYFEDGTMIVRVKDPGNDWLQGMILGFGADVEVLEPETMREDLKEIGRNIYELYSGKH